MTSIIVDCDPGHDDAIAIFTAAHHCELVGLTAVSGNAPLSMTAPNAALIAQIGGIDVPVRGGAAGPLVGEAQHAPGIHGKTGLDGPDLPERTKPIDDNDAVGWLIETLRSGVVEHLVPIGPLTNVALALRQAPDLVSCIDSISLMGGSVTFGNSTPVTEFNVWADPEAAAAVFECGARIKMCGLNLTHQFLVTKEVTSRIADIGGEVARFALDLFDFYRGAYAARGGMSDPALHDPCAGASCHTPRAVRVGASPRGRRAHRDPHARHDRRRSTVVDRRRAC